MSELLHLNKLDANATNAETTLNASHRFNDASFLETGKSLSPSSINAIAKITYIPHH